jgi:hypothetical protein
MGAAQIILRDTGDGRVEVAVMTAQLGPIDMSRAVLGLLLSALGQVADVRGIGEGLARGDKMITDKVMIMQTGEAVTIDESVNALDLDTLMQCGGHA